MSPACLTSSFSPRTEHELTLPDWIRKICFCSFPALTSESPAFKLMRGASATSSDKALRVGEATRSPASTKPHCFNSSSFMCVLVLFLPSTSSSFSTTACVIAGLVSSLSSPIPLLRNLTSLCCFLTRSNIAAALPDPDPAPARSTNDTSGTTAVSSTSLSCLKIMLGNKLIFRAPVGVTFPDFGATNGVLFPAEFRNCLLQPALAVPGNRISDGVPYLRGVICGV
mmetsp:Transcript_30366/g.71941  ORF Transcript_30366/g.71941 Transcript_30366/m.71941 type:complete len:226 (+) Transcript_30366:131-808(+)